MIHIVGYGLLSLATSKLLLEALENHKLNIVILDESHYLKNRKSARTKHLLQICKKAKHAILLSGTPSLARPREVCEICFHLFVDCFCLEKIELTFSLFLSSSFLSWTLSVQVGLVLSVVSFRGTAMHAMYFSEERGALTQGIYGCTVYNYFL